jgi:23S rRNA U2552 (ribose-2'-O)-methylase RlmE/FtsJ
MLNKNNLVLNHNPIEHKSFKIEISKTINTHDFCIELYTILNIYKNLINNIPNKSWDTVKKKTNQFELINTKTSLINYVPISRAYYKMWELLKDNNLVNNKKSLSIVGLAEGPGGFTECIYNYRSKYFSRFTDRYICMSLFPSNGSIPSWKDKLLNKSNIEIYYGKDSTGNLYNISNILSLKIKCNQNVDFVTCDGGFNFADDYDHQEQMSYQLILCQIIASINILNKGGSLVIKIFDIFTVFTVKIIYFLTTLFQKTVITKPHTSRPANSEKYIVCTDFIGLNPEIITKLNIVIKDWVLLTQQKKYVTDIFEFDLPEDFKNLIHKYNYSIVYNQVKNIISTLLMIDLKTTNFLKKSQIDSCKKWCSHYDISYNHNI